MQPPSPTTPTPYRAGPDGADGQPSIDMTTELSHDAYLYETDEAFVETIVPFLRGGLEAGAPTAVATTPSHIALLRDAMGTDADDVHLFPDGAWYVRPASTVEGWRRELRRRGGGLRVPSRIVGEVLFGEGAARQRTWTRFESTLNGVFAGTPAWIVCPYDRRRLAPQVIADAARTHPVLWNGERHPSDRYEKPEAFLRAEPELPIDTEGSPTLSIQVHGRPGEVRSALRRAVAEALPPQRVEDLALVATELVANTIVHGGGAGTVAAWVRPGSTTLEVRDSGPGLADPLAGYRPPEPGSVGGMGLWVVRRLADAVTVDASDAGTTVRIRIDG